MAFEPEYCPYDDCVHHRRAPFPWRRRGFFRRNVDGRRVQRFECLGCQRRFSTQTFRLDYRLKKLHLTGRVFEHLVAKTTLRQIGRSLETTRKTVERRLALLGDHCARFHAERLRRARARGGFQGDWSLDELETYEADRKLKPVTVPVLIDRRTGFVVHTECAPLAPRGSRTPSEEERLKRIQASEGRRRSGSTRAIKRTFGVLAKNVVSTGVVQVTTDEKKSYGTCLRQLFGERLEHITVSSRRKRDTRNPLFRINHTLAMLRDGISRLVRQTWAASKDLTKLHVHLWVWNCYRNYVRPMTNAEARKGGKTPAMAMGLATRRWRPIDLLRWKVGPPQERQDQ